MTRRVNARRKVAVDARAHDALQAAVFAVTEMLNSGQRVMGLLDTGATVGSSIVGDMEQIQRALEQLHRDINSDLDALRREGRRRTASADETASVGSIVEYEDRANPPRRYVVVAVPGSDDFGQFTLRSVDPEQGYAYHTSDLRQAGWRMISANRRTADMDDMDIVDTWLLSIGLGLFGENSYTDAADAFSAGEQDCRTAMESEGLQSEEAIDVMYAAKRRARLADEEGIPLMVSYWQGVAFCAEQHRPG